MRRLKFWSYKEDYFPEIIPIIWRTPLSGIWSLICYWMKEFWDEIPDQIMSIRYITYPDIALKDKADVIFKCIFYPLTFSILYFRVSLPLFVCLVVTHILGSIEMSLFNGLMFAVFSATHVSLFGKYDSWGKDFLTNTVREGAEEIKDMLLDMPAEYFYSCTGFFKGLPSDIAKNTYRGLMKKFHPDIPGGDKVAAQIITEEYRKHCGYLNEDGSLFENEFSQK